MSAILDPAAELKALMALTEKNEVACQGYLPFAHHALAPHMSEVVQVVREQVAVAGRSDYFLLCDVHEVQTRRRLVLWEAKAPQLPPFKVSTANRLTPSRDLVDAENQLLYYYDEYRTNHHFLHRYGIAHPDDVRLGGIIIGREDNWVAPSTTYPLSPLQAKQLATSAYRIRNEHFYQHRIRLITWDHILSVVQPPPAPVKV